MATSPRKNNEATAKAAKVLLTNDDGVQAQGIASLYEAIARKRAVLVVAPDREQSGVGHAFTFNKPLHYERAGFNGRGEAYTITGTPVDCVKFAVSFLMPQRPIAVVAGMNVGENSGLSAFYSGTVAAVREGAFWDIPSVAFSLCQGGEKHLPAYAGIAADILALLLTREKRKKNHRVYYNVNFPPCAPHKSRGIRITAQSMAFFDDRYETIDVETHHSKKGFVIYGEKNDIERSNTFDSRALMNNYITITPLSFDATAALPQREKRRLEQRIQGRGYLNGR
jgi:5'-nucleotidase